MINLAIGEVISIAEIYQHHIDRQQPENIMYEKHLYTLKH